MLHFLSLEARRREGGVSQERLQAATDRFRRRLGLISADHTEEWLEAQQMSTDDLVHLMTLEVTLETLLKEAGGPIRRLLPLELQRRGEFAAEARRIGEKKAVLEQRGVRSLTLEDVGVSFADLMAWYRERCEPVDGTLARHAELLGFETAREFLSELLLDYSVATLR